MRVNLAPVSTIKVSYLQKQKSELYKNQMTPEEEQQDARRFSAKQSKFRGSAKVDLRFLAFDNAASKDQASFLDPKNVNRLEKIFDSKDASGRTWSTTCRL